MGRDVYCTRCGLRARIISGNVRECGCGGLFALSETQSKPPTDYRAMAVELRKALEKARRSMERIPGVVDNWKTSWPPHDLIDCCDAVLTLSSELAPTLPGDAGKKDGG